MKRFLSWLALIVCYFAVCMLVSLDGMLLNYIWGLYDQLSPFLKIIVIIIGGTFVFGLAVAPVYYGSILTLTWCEKISESKKGTRYTVMGIFILLCCVLEAVTDFHARDIPIGIYGIVLMVFGANTRKAYHRQVVEMEARRLIDNGYKANDK